jgi:hypothetical protein
MEIGIGDADVPGDEAMRADLDSFLGHNERAIHQREIAYGTPAVHADRERTTSITGDVIAEDDGARRFAFQMAKNLRALAIEALAENDVGRNGILPPIAFDASFAVNVAHDG